MWTTLLVVLPLFGLTVAERLQITRHPGTDCFYSCTGSLTTLTFGDVPPDAESYYAKLAGSNYLLTSVVGCIETYCTSEISYNGALEGWENYIGYAMEYGPNVVMPTFEAMKAITPPLEGITRMDVLGADLTVPVNETVIPDQANYDIWYKTLVSISKGVRLYVWLTINRRLGRWRIITTKRLGTRYTSCWEPWSWLASWDGATTGSPIDPLQALKKLDDHSERRLHLRRHSPQNYRRDIGNISRHRHCLVIDMLLQLTNTSPSPPDSKPSSYVSPHLTTRTDADTSDLPLRRAQRHLLLRGVRCL